MVQIPRKTLAAVLMAQHEPLAIAEIDLPNELDYGQVLVKVLVSGICGSQLGEISGVKGPDPYLPHLMGHEGAGEVMEIGPGVKYVKPGDRVIMHWRKGAGIEAQPPKYRWGERAINAGYVTTFNEYAVVSENRLTPYHSSVSAEIAALFGCAVTTGFGVVVNDARLTIGESLVVWGAGGIGLNIIQAAQLTSVDPIIAVDLWDDKLELARRCGATHLINARTSNVSEELRKILGGFGADVVVDNTGNPQVIAQAYEWTKPQGRTILVGVPRAGELTSLYTLPLHFGKVLTGSHGGSAAPAQDIPRYLNLLIRGKYALDHLITERCKLADINSTIARMRSGQVVGRAIVTMGFSDGTRA